MYDCVFAQGKAINVVMSLLNKTPSNEEKYVLSLSTMNSFKDVHAKKGFSPMLVTLPGMLTEVKPEQLPKAMSPIEVTVLGMVMPVNAVQYRKA